MTETEINEKELLDERLLFAREKRKDRETADVVAAYEEAIRIAQRNGWKYREAEIRNQLGLYYISFSVPTANEKFLTALTLFQQLGDKPKIAELETNIGSSYRMMGLRDKAITHYEQALAMLKNENQDEMLLRLYANLAGLYYNLEDHKKTDDYIQEAIALSYKIKNPKITARLLINHASYQQKTGDFEYAATAVDTAERIAHEFEDEELLAMAKESRGFGYLLQCKYEKAIACLTEVVEYFLSVGNPQLEGQIHTNIGFCFEQLGDEESAETSYRRALEIGKQTGNNTTVAINLQNIANRRMSQNDLITAKRLFYESWDIARTIKDPFTESGIIKDIGVLLFTEGEREEGKRLIKSAIGTFRSLGSNDALVSALCEYILNLIDEQNYEEAELMLKDAEYCVSLAIEKSSFLSFELTVLRLRIHTSQASDFEKSGVFRHYHKCLDLIERMKLPKQNAKVINFLSLRDRLIAVGVTPERLELPNPIEKE